MDCRPLFVLLLLLICCLVVHGTEQKAVVIEVDHTETYIKIYKWNPDKLYHGMPSDLKLHHSNKFRKLEKKVLLNYDPLKSFIEGLLKEVQDHLPYAEEPKADTYFIMRPKVLFDYNDFPKANITKVLKELVPKFNLQFKHVNYLVPDGDATIQWLALNYLRGAFFSGGPDLAGYLELNSNVESNACLYTEPKTYGGVTLGTRFFELFFPHEFPLDLLKRRLLEKLKSKSPIVQDPEFIHDPCALFGYRETTTVLGSKVTVEGRPNFADCDWILDDFVKSDRYQYKSTTGLNQKQDIYMLGELLDSVEYTKVAKREERFTPNDLEKATRSYCSMNVEVAEKSTYYIPTRETISNFCLINHYGLKLILKLLKIGTHNRNLIYTPNFNGQLPDRGMGTILQVMCDNDKCNPSSAGNNIYSFFVICSGILFSFINYY